MNQIYKKIIGIFAILIGLIALVTPFTPGASFLIFIGLQFLGFHFLFLDKLMEFLRLKKPEPRIKNHPQG